MRQVRHIKITVVQKLLHKDIVCYAFKPLEMPFYTIVGVTVSDLT